MNPARESSMPRNSCKRSKKLVLGTCFFYLPIQSTNDNLKLKKEDGSMEQTELPMNLEPYRAWWLGYFDNTNTLPSFLAGPVRAADITGYAIMAECESLSHDVEDIEYFLYCPATKEQKPFDLKKSFPDLYLHAARFL
jgi:hypothetical protein